MMTLRREFDRLASEHFDGTPSVHTTQRLDHILQEHPKLRQEYAAQVMMHRLLTECCRPASGRRAFDFSACPPAPARPWFVRLVDAIRQLVQPSYCPTCHIRR